MRYIVLLLMFVLILTGCRSTSYKRITKDIIGINEQLYDLEKEQIKADGERQKLLDDFAAEKKEKEEKPQEEDADDPDEIYKDGYKNYLEQKYPEAIAKLSKLTLRFSEADHALTDNALYWQAESNYKLNKIDEALKYYQLLYRYFPFSNKADYALYKIGMIFYTRGDNARARLAFSRLTGEYPHSDLYKAALLKIKQIKKKRRK